MTAPEVKAGQVWRRRDDKNLMLWELARITAVEGVRVSYLPEPPDRIEEPAMVTVDVFCENYQPDLPEIGSRWQHERYGVNELQTVRAAGDWGVALQRPDGLPGAVTLDYFRRNYVPFVEAPRLPDCEGWLNVYSHGLGAFYTEADPSAAMLQRLHVGGRDGVPFAELEQP